LDWTNGLRLNFLRKNEFDGGGCPLCCGHRVVLGGDGGHVFQEEAEGGGELAANGINYS
jgi:hypothetical protein